MIRRHWLPALVFAGLALALTNPLVLHIWNAVEDKQDALLNTWIMAWIGHAAITDPSHFFTTNIFYPYLNSLAFSEVVVPQGLLAFPLSLATDNPIFGYNVVLLAMLWLDAFAMYLLVLDWTGRREAGLVAGVIYAFSPFNLGNLAQIQLISLGWLPMALIYLRQMKRARTGQVGTRSAALFALFFVLQSLSSLYYALIGGVAVICYIVYLLPSHRGARRFEQAAEQSQTDPGHKEKQPRDSFFAAPVRFLLYLVLSAIIIGIVLVPFLLPYFAVQRELGFERTLQESEPFSASMKQYTEASPQNVVYGKFLAPNPVRYAGGYPLDNLFPGLFAVALAFIGLVLGKGNERWLWLAVLLVAFVLALGPRLYLATGQATNITLPYRWLYDLFSPLRALRAPVRFESLVMLALAGLAGIGIASLLPQPPSALAARRSLLFTLGWVALIAAEYLAVPAANVTRVPVAGEISPVYRWLAGQPHGVALELPLMGPDAYKRLDISKQYYTTYHWQDTPDGYSGFNPAGREAFELELRGFPNPRAMSLLRAYNVQYLIMHWDELAAIPGTPTQSQLEDVEGLSLAKEWPNVSVYAVAPGSQASAQLDKSLYVPHPVSAGSPFTAFVILHNTGIAPFATRAADRVGWVATWNQGHQETVRTGVPLVTASASVLPVRLTAPRSTGNWRLDLRAESGPLGAFSLAQDVTVGQESATETVIPAQVEPVAPLNSTYGRGETVDVALDWLPLDKIDAYYSASVRLVDEQGNKVLNVDREPSRQTLLWIPDTIVKDTFELKLPGDLRSGKYRVEVLMYDANSDTSVLLLDRGFRPVDRVQLGEIEVK